MKTHMQDSDNKVSVEDEQPQRHYSHNILPSLMSVQNLTAMDPKAAEVFQCGCGETARTTSLQSRHMEIRS